MTNDNTSQTMTPLLGLQMLFVAFGALVLVPILTGLNPSVALFTAGIGTLAFQFITGRQIPIFLASSFAFIAPIIIGVEQFGMAATLGGLFAAGVVYMILAGLVAWRGQGFIHRLLPPVVVGPVIMVIGLSLAPVAVNMALGKTGDGAAVLVPQHKAIIVAAVALIATIATSMLAKGLLKLIPILVGIIAGYLVSLVMGLVDFGSVGAAPVVAMPAFTFPEFNWAAILFIVPVAIAPAIEHIGDMLAISNVTKKDFLEKPGLHRTLLGDGVATSLAAVFGGPPNTTYSEVTGAVTLTKAFNPIIMIWAAVFAIILSFSGTLGAILGTIPVPVMGGIMLLLFGMIAAVGMGTLVRDGTDMSEARNLIIVSLILVFGIGGMVVGFGDFSLSGIGLAAVTGIILNLVLPATRTD
ncbi:MAG: uracil-xanthine permease family protein [Pseudomonadota bacterium]